MLNSHVQWLHAIITKLYISPTEIIILQIIWICWKTLGNFSARHSALQRKSLQWYLLEEIYVNNSLIKTIRTQPYKNGSVSLSIIYLYLCDVDTISKAKRAQNNCIKFIYGIEKFELLLHKLVDLTWLNLRNRIRKNCTAYFINYYYLGGNFFRTDVHNMRKLYCISLRKLLHVPYSCITNF